MKRIRDLLYSREKKRESSIKKEKDVSRSTKLRQHLSIKSMFLIGTNILYQKLNNIKIFISSFIISLLLLPGNAHAVEKIEGGNITIEKLGTIIKGLAVKIQIFGVILAFVATLIFTVQYIIGDDETKQRKKKTIIYTLAGVGLLILVPSIINFIIDMLG